MQRVKYTVDFKKQVISEFLALIVNIVCDIH